MSLVTTLLDLLGLLLLAACAGAVVTGLMMGGPLLAVGCGSGVAGAVLLVGSWLIDAVRGRS